MWTPTDVIAILLIIVCVPALLFVFGMLFSIFRELARNEIRWRRLNKDLEREKKERKLKQ